jgi:hypothetical protein
MQRLFSVPSFEKGKIPGSISPVELLTLQDKTVLAGDGRFKASGLKGATPAFLGRMPEAVFRRGKNAFQITITIRSVIFHEPSIRPVAVQASTSFVCPS